MFDIHATSSDSQPFVCADADQPEQEPWYGWFPVENILFDREHVLSQDFGSPETGTTDYFVNKFGGSAWSEKKYGKKKGLGFCYETGQQNDLTKVDQAFSVMLRLLKETGVITDEFFNAVQTQPSEAFCADQKKYVLRQCINAEEDQFTYAPGMDQGWKEAKKGDVLGHYQSGKAVLVPEDGLLLFNRAPAKIKQGRSLFYIAQPL